VSGNKRMKNYIDRWDNNIMQRSEKELKKVYLDVKFQLSQLTEDIPFDTKKQVDERLRVIHNTLYVIMPANNELTLALKKLSFTKYPEFNDNSIPYIRELVSQICVDIANMIVENTNSLLVDLINNNTPYIDSEEQFQELVTFFARPLEEPEEPVNVTGTSSLRTINHEKKEFLDVIMKVLFRYFEKSFNKLNDKGWQLIGISLGHQFLVYLKRCYVLMGGLAEGIITKNPGISYKDLEKKLSEQLSAPAENEWMLKL
jgi:hypothetical protein